MAQQDVQWPSEDEDFDAVSDGKKFAVAEFGDKPITDHQPVAPAQSQAPQTTPTTVRVVDDSESEPEPETEPAPHQQTEPAAQHDIEVANHQEASPEEPTTVEPAIADHPETVEAPQPVAAAVKPPKPPKPPRVRSGTPGWVRGLFEVVLIVAVAGLGLWAWTLHTDNKDLNKQVTQLNANPQIAVQKQTQDLIAQVGSLMTLPKDEQPTIANVSDASKAKQQSVFFNNAQNGDKVLMYVKAGEAILFRPSTGKIILVAPLTFSSNQTGSTTTPTTTPIVAGPTAVTKTTP